MRRHLSNILPTCCCYDCYYSNNLRGEAAFDISPQFFENSEIPLKMQVHKKHINSENDGNQLSVDTTSSVNFLREITSDRLSLGAGEQQQNWSQILRNKIFRLALHLANEYCLVMHNLHISQKSGDQNVQQPSGS